jgi:hypothetical protein
MRQLPPRRPKGSPRVPGSGRRPGSPNRKTIELRQLMGELVGNVDYQARFSRAFRRRALHPATEMKVWEYVVGKPTQAITVSADLTLDARLREERALFERLDLPDLERLAAKSQALVDEALALVEAQRVKDTRAMLPAAPVTPDGSPPLGEPGPGPDDDR